MLTIFGAVAELERAYILQRQREGLRQRRHKANTEDANRSNLLLCWTLLLSGSVEN